jgi:hypothetical protein
MSGVVVSAFAQVITARPGDNLFALAAFYLGDATQWNRIAQLNLAALGGVADPFIQPGAFLELSLPPVKIKGGNGGIFGL